ncbi:hypothetical protein GJAV_G00100800 [Gymnothorax javanicus]|nr:hypothetical protein GJAV_G00100800 [Gymnothorax javanicus]
MGINIHVCAIFDLLPNHGTDQETLICIFCAHALNRKKSEATDDTLRLKARRSTSSPRFRNCVCDQYKGEYVLAVLIWEQEAMIESRLAKNK